MKKFLIAALLLAALATMGYADGCYRGGRSYSYSYSAPSYSYSAPTYSAPYVAPAAAPYKPEYAAYRFLLAFPVVELPSYGAVYQAPVAGLSVPQQQQSPKSAAFEGEVLKKLDDLGRGLKELGDRVERIERSGRQVQPQQQPQPQASPFQPAPEQPKQPEPIGPPAVEKAFVDSNAASCVMCHGRGNEKKNGGGFVYTEADGSPRVPPLTAEEREAVQFQLVNGMMPPKSAKAQSLGVRPLTKEGGDAHFRELDRQIAVAGAARKAAKK